MRTMLIHIQHFTMIYFRKVINLKNHSKLNLSLKLKTLLGVGLCVSILLTSCTDDESEVGLNLQNPGDLAVVYNDSTTSLYTYTYQQYDSIYLSPANLLLGYNVDEKIGHFQNSFMTEVLLSTYNGVSFGENPVADEMILYLDYNASYGDTSQIQTIIIYELNKDLSLHDTANSIHGRPMEDAVIAEYYYPIPIKTFSFTPNPSDTLPLKIVMPESFKNRFLDTTLYASIDTFQRNVFRGFYFKALPIANGGAISYFNPGDSTRMELSYRNDEDTVIYRYNISTSSYRCNLFNREPNSQINSFPTESDPDTNLVQELFYVKFNNAFEGRIDITGLQTWADSGIFTLNKAILDIYTVQPETDLDSTYYPLPPLQILKVDDEHKRTYLDEYLNLSTGVYATVGHDTLSGGFGYHININKSIYQAIQNGDDKISILITAENDINKSYPNRVILKGKLNTEHPLKLKMTYTKLNVD